MDGGERCLQANNKKKKQNKIKPVLLGPAVPAEEALTAAPRAPAGQQDQVLLETTRSTSVGPACTFPSAYSLRGFLIMAVNQISKPPLPVITEDRVSVSQGESGARRRGVP